MNLTIVDGMSIGKSCYVTVQGLVQGVGFRYYTQQQAQLLGIDGWVRNCPDGSVKVLISGDDKAITAMLAWLQHGPSSAVVNHIEVTETEEMIAYSGFKITA